MSSRRLTDLLPACYKRAEQFTSRCEREGIEIMVYCTYRGRDEQAALYMQGRNPIYDVNVARARCGLPKIDETENKIVTYAESGESMHNYRLAFDCVPLEGGKPVWAVGAFVWQTVGEIGIECGLEWAGLWKKKRREFPHFQFIGGLSLDEIKAGKLPV